MLARLALAGALSLLAAPLAAQPAIQVYVNAVDYPVDVRPREQPYRVAVSYRLDRAGRIADCRVINSSRQPSLDAETCRILRTRARFRPERGQMQGRLEFVWNGRDSLRPDIFRGEPITVGLFFSTDDYPPAALRESQQGKVRYAVEVSPRGAPQRCTVLESSGSEALDRRTCDLIMQRAAYIPATDGNGPLGGVTHGSVTWRLPGS